MKRKRFSEVQIITILKAHQADVPLADLALNLAPIIALAANLVYPLVKQAQLNG